MNRYYEPVSIDFQSTYVPIPFQELVTIGRELNARRDAAEKQLRDANREWGKFQTMSDVDRAAYNAETFDRMKPLLDQFAADPNMIKTAAGQAAISNLINTTDYGKLAQLELGAKAYAQRAENIAKLEAAGKYNKDWDDVDMKNWSTLDKGVVDLSPIEYMSLEELSTPYVSALKPSFVAGNVNPNTGEKLSYTKGWMAITDQDLMRSLNPVMNDIIKTPQGQKWLDTYRAAASRVNPNADAAQKESLAHQMMYEALIASQSDRRTAAPVTDELAIANAKSNGAKKQLEGIVEDMMSRIFPAQADYSESTFARYVSDENKNTSEVLQKLRAQYLKNQQIINDSVSSEEAKAAARSENESIYSELERNQDFEYDAIMQGVANDLNGGVDSEYYSTQVNTGKNKDTGNYIEYDGPAIPKLNMMPNVGIRPGLLTRSTEKDRSLQENSEKAKRDPNNFFLHNNQYNGGYFNTNTNTFHGSEPQQLFHTQTTALMTPTEPGESESFEQYLFDKERSDVNGISLYQIRNRQSLRPMLHYLSDKNKLLSKKASDAGLNLSKLKRQDYDLEQWIRSGKVSNVYVDGLNGLDFTTDLVGKEQFQGLVNVYAPLDEIADQTNAMFGWGVESDLKQAGFEIKSDASGKKYVIVPMVYTRPLTPQMKNYVNNVYNEKIGLSDTYNVEVERIRNTISQMLGITNIAQQYTGLNTQDLVNYDGQ